MRIILLLQSLTVNSEDFPLTCAHSDMFYGYFTRVLAGNVPENVGSNICIHLHSYILPPLQKFQGNVLNSVHV